MTPRTELLALMAAQILAGIDSVSVSMNYDGRGPRAEVYHLTPAQAVEQAQALLALVESA